MTKTVKPTTSRRAFLASAPALAVVGTAPASAAAAFSVTPELAKLIEEWQVARTNYLGLKTIDDAATQTYLATAPEIPERIEATKITYINRTGDALRRAYPDEQSDHLFEPLRRGGGATLKASWWRLKLSMPHNHQCTATWTENIAIAEAFEATDEAAKVAAGYGSVDDELETACDLVNKLDREIEEFDAQSLADIAAIARVSKVIAEEQEIFKESWDDLIANILAVAGREGV